MSTRRYVIPLSPDALRSQPIDEILSMRTEVALALVLIDREMVGRGLRVVAAAPRPREQNRALAVLAAVALGAHDPNSIRIRTGQTIHATYQTLARLTRLGRLVRVEQGRYELPGRPDEPVAEAEAPLPCGAPS